MSPAPEPLLPPFKAGESLTIQRNVGGQNVLMVVTAEDPCALGPRNMILRAKPTMWGISSYADGRVDRQQRSITRLVAERQRVLELAVELGATKIVDLLTSPDEAEEEPLKLGPLDDLRIIK